MRPFRDSRQARIRVRRVELALRNWCREAACPARLRVFNQQEKLIAIAEAIVPRAYQPIVVLDAEP